MTDTQRIILNHEVFFSQLKVIELDRPIYDHQRKAAEEIFRRFEDNPNLLNVMCVALMQSGKTGILVAFIHMYIRYKKTNPIPIENIFIITNTSSVDWVNQTKERVPQCIHNNIYHHADLQKLFDRLQNMEDISNIMICLDEPQVASLIDQKLAKLMKDCGIFTKEERLKRDIKMVEVSATPNATLKSVQDWGEEYSNVLPVAPAEGHIGYETLKRNNQIRQFKNLVGPENVNNIREIKHEMQKYKSNRYHLVRLKTGEDYYETIGTFKRIFEDDVDYTEYTQESQWKDINDLLKKKPSKHTIIFIKEKLRCAKSIHMKYMGILYERFSQSPDDSVIVQGFFGRCHGYHTNSDCIIYTNMDSVEKYQDMYEKSFDYNQVPWTSNTTKARGNKTVCKPTFNNELNNRPVKRSTVKLVHSEGFKNFEDAVKYVRKFGEKHYPGRKFQPLKQESRGMNSNGFYYTTSHTTELDIDSKKVLDEKDFKNENSRINNTTLYRIEAFYLDKTDRTTLRWGAIVNEKDTSL